MQPIAQALGDPQFFLGCAANHGNMWDGGNQWSPEPAWISFLRHVAKLELDYSNWDHYETLALVCGPRIMHAEFAMISDRPEVLMVDERSRPHCDDGPFCRWRDGTALYSIHGIRVPQFVVEHPERVTVADIEAEQNAEVRRVMIDRYGVSRYVHDAKFEVLDEDEDPLGQPRRLLRRGRIVVVELTNSTEDADGTRRKYHVPCHPELRPLPFPPDNRLGEPQAMTALNAVASTYGFRGEEYRLRVET
jgi:hypothetical protein